MGTGDPYVADDLENAQRAQRTVQLAEAYHRSAVGDDATASLLADAMHGHRLTTRQLDTLVEGLTIHRAFDAEPNHRDAAIEPVDQITNRGGAPHG